MDPCEFFCHPAPLGDNLYSKDRAKVVPPARTYGDAGAAAAAAAGGEAPLEVGGSRRVSDDAARTPSFFVWCHFHVTARSQLSQQKEIDWLCAHTRGSGEHPLAHSKACMDMQGGKPAAASTSATGTNFAGDACGSCGRLRIFQKTRRKFQQAALNLDFQVQPAPTTHPYHPLSLTPQPTAEEQAPTEGSKQALRELDFLAGLIKGPKGSGSTADAGGPGVSVAAGDNFRLNIFQGEEGQAAVPVKAAAPRELEFGAGGRNDAYRRAAGLTVEGLSLDGGLGGGAGVDLLELMDSTEQS